MCENTSHQVALWASLLNRSGTVSDSLICFSNCMGCTLLSFSTRLFVCLLILLLLQPLHVPTHPFVQASVDLGQVGCEPAVAERRHPQVADLTLTNAKVGHTRTQTVRTNGKRLKTGTKITKTIFPKHLFVLLPTILLVHVCTCWAQFHPKRGDHVECRLTQAAPTCQTAAETDQATAHTPVRETKVWSHVKLQHYSENPF